MIYTPKAPPKHPIIWKDVSPFFKPHEILSPDTLSTPHCVDLDSLVLLNELRKYVDCLILVNHGKNLRRGVRSSREQLLLVKMYGAALNSSHVAGKAFDITIPELSLQETAQAAKDVGFVFTKIYEKANFVHIDFRNLIIVT
jgi:hypothetical protein